MSESATKRVRRTPEERAAAIDEKIQRLNTSITEIKAKKEAAIADFDARISAAEEHIKNLEQQKKALFEPQKPRKPRKTKKQKISEMIQLAQKKGMKLEDIASRLEIELAE